MPEPVLNNKPQHWETESLLALGVEVAGLGLGWVDYLQDTITLDPRAAAFFGFKANTPLSRELFHSRIHSGDRDRVMNKVQSVLLSEKEGFADVTHRVIHPDGTLIWLQARKRIRFETCTKTGDLIPTSGIVAILDVTPFKNSERRVKLLMQEVNHRVKNLLTVVQGISRMTFRSGDIETFPERFAARLSALSANQDLLVENTTDTVSLTALVNAQISPFQTRSTPRIIISGSDVSLSGDQAQAIALALHELATNATKYGALSVEGGTVTLGWNTIDAANEGDIHSARLRIEWREVGGPTVAPPSRKGFGTKLIENMAAQGTGGLVDYRFLPEGVCWSLDAPIAASRPALP